METGISGRDTASNMILEALLKEPLGFEKLVQSLEGKASRGTVNKYLKELVVNEKMVELAPQKNYGEKPFYQITELNKSRVAEMVEAYRKKQEFGPKFEGLIGIASPEELRTLTKAILSFPQWEFSDFIRQKIFERTGQNFDVSSFQGVIYNIRTRELLKQFKLLKAPQEILEVGERIVSGQATTAFENLTFYYYPADIDSAIDWLKFDLKMQQDGQATYLEIVERQNPKLGKIIRQRYTDFLGKDFENLILETRRKWIAEQKNKGPS